MHPVTQELIQIALHKLGDAGGIHRDQPEQPKNLRDSMGSAQSCRTCKHFTSGLMGDGQCDKYKYPVQPTQVCDSYEPQSFTPPDELPPDPGQSQPFQGTFMGTAAPTPKMAMFPNQMQPAATPLPQMAQGNAASGMTPPPAQPLMPTNEQAMETQGQPQMAQQPSQVATQDQAAQQTTSGAPVAGQFKPSPTLALSPRPDIQASASFVPPDPNLMQAPQGQPMKTAYVSTHKSFAASSVRTRDKLGFAMAAGRNADPKVLAAINELQSAPGIDVFTRLDAAFGKLANKLAEAPQLANHLSNTHLVHKRAYEGAGGLPMTDDGKPALGNNNLQRRPVRRGITHHPALMKHTKMARRSTPAAHGGSAAATANVGTVSISPVSIWQFGQDMFDESPPPNSANTLRRPGLGQYSTAPRIRPTIRTKYAGTAPAGYGGTGTPVHDPHRSNVPKPKVTEKLSGDVPMRNEVPADAMGSGSLVEKGTKYAVSPQLVSTALPRLDDADYRAHMAKKAEQPLARNYIPPANDVTDPNMAQKAWQRAKGVAGSIYDTATYSAPKPAASAQMYVPKDYRGPWNARMNEGLRGQPAPAGFPSVAQQAAANQQMMQKQQPMSPLRQRAIQMAQQQKAQQPAAPAPTAAPKPAPIAKPMAAPAASKPVAPKPAAGAMASKPMGKMSSFLLKSAHTGSAALPAAMTKGPIPGAGVKPMTPPAVKPPAPVAAPTAPANPPAAAPAHPSPAGPQSEMAQRSNWLAGGGLREMSLGGEQRNPVQAAPGHGSTIGKVAPTALVTEKLALMGQLPKPLGPTMNGMTNLLGQQSPTAKITPPEPPKKGKANTTQPAAVSTPMQSGASPAFNTPKMAQDLHDRLTFPLFKRDVNELRRYVAELREKIAYEDHSKINAVPRRSIIKQQLPVHPQPDPHQGNSPRTDSVAVTTKAGAASAPVKKSILTMESPLVKQADPFNHGAGGPAFNTHKVQFPSSSTGKAPFRMPDRFSRNRSDMSDWMKVGELARSAAERHAMKMAAEPAGNATLMPYQADPKSALTDQAVAQLKQLNDQLAKAEPGTPQWTQIEQQRQAAYSKAFQSGISPTQIDRALAPAPGANAAAQAPAPVKSYNQMTPEEQAQHNQQAEAADKERLAAQTPAQKAQQDAEHAQQQQQVNKITQQGGIAGASPMEQKPQKPKVRQSGPIMFGTMGSNRATGAATTWNPRSKQDAGEDPESVNLAQSGDFKAWQAHKRKQQGDFYTGEVAQPKAPATPAAPAKPNAVAQAPGAAPAQPAAPQQPRGIAPMRGTPGWYAQQRQRMQQMQQPPQMAQAPPAAPQAPGAAPQPAPAPGAAPAAPPAGKTPIRTKGEQGGGMDLAMGGMGMGGGMKQTPRGMRRQQGRMQFRSGTATM